MEETTKEKNSQFRSKTRGGSSGSSGCGESGARSKSKASCCTLRASEKWGPNAPSVANEAPSPVSTVLVPDLEASSKPSNSNSVHAGVGGSGTAGATDFGVVGGAGASRMEISSVELQPTTSTDSWLCVSCRLAGMIAPAWVTCEEKPTPAARTNATETMCIAAARRKWESHSGIRSVSRATRSAVKIQPKSLLSVKRVQPHDCSTLRILRRRAA
jgi:hypothetical protein